jgi:hypothetical protein
MTPAYLRKLADVADPDELWRVAGLSALKLPAYKRTQLDMGVALRRYASHIADLNAALVAGKSHLITPITPNSYAARMIATPVDHRRLRRAKLK